VVLVFALPMPAAANSIRGSSTAETFSAYDAEMPAAVTAIIANRNFLANENENIPETELRRGNRGLLISFYEICLNFYRRTQASSPHSTRRL